MIIRKVKLEDLIEKGNKKYKEVGFIFDLKRENCEELELIFPTIEYKEQVMEYLQEFFDNGEYEIAGDGGLDRLKDFDKWLIKIQNDLSEENIKDNRIPATLYLTIRKSDNKIVGNLQIRHKLNERLLLCGGHIGDSVRPTERRKGYATAQIKLALQKCKELGIDNVLMDCDKVNIASAKSIINNGGVLENEVYVDNILIQKYRISLKKRFVTNPEDLQEVKQGSLQIKNFDDKYFKGDVALIRFDKMYEPYIIDESNLCIAKNNYKWLEFYNYKKRIKLTAMYNDRNQIIEWYFDIARKIGKENGLPFEDDLYLDVVLTPNGEVKLIDEDELKAAYNRLEVTKEVYDEAYKLAYDLIEKIQGKQNEMKRFTDEYLEKFNL